MAGKLVTHDQLERMIANARRSASDEAHDPFPVVKLTAGPRAVWLLSEVDPDDHDADL